MYTIQKYKAEKYILSVLPYDPNIKYENGIPKISYTRKYSELSNDRVTTFLEDICWSDPGSSDIIVHNILQIYGIHHRFTKHADTIYFPHLQTKLLFSLWRSVSGKIFFSINAASMSYVNMVTTIGRSITYEMLLFLIDPLQVINKLDHKHQDITVQHFFDYYRDTIIKQDKELLKKYVLVRHLVSQFEVMDIMYAIIDSVVNIFL